MSGKMFQDITVVRVATDVPQRAFESDAYPGREGELGVRLVDGELLYSDEWLDADDATPEDVDRGA